MNISRTAVYVASFVLASGFSSQLLYAQPATNLADLQTCLNGTASVCQLAPNPSGQPYLVGGAQPVITVNRAVIVQGTSNPYPIIKRDRSGGNGPLNLLTVGAANVTLEELTIDGGYDNSSHYNQPTSCFWVAGNACNKGVGVTCDNYNDVLVFNVPNVVITSMQFQNAAYNSIQSQAPGISISNSYFSNGLGAGIQSGNGSAIIWSNTFTNMSGAAISIGGASNNGTVIGNFGDGNALHHNHWDQPDCADGGQIYLGNGVDNVTVTGNTIAGDYNPSDYGRNTGVEIDPDAKNITLQSNNVYSHGMDGENIKWNSHVQITNESISYNARYGISVLGVGDCLSACVSDPLVSLTNVSSSNNCQSGSVLCQWQDPPNYVIPPGTDVWLFQVNTANAVCSTTNLGVAINSPYPTNGYVFQSNCPFVLNQ